MKLVTRDLIHAGSSRRGSSQKNSQTHTKKSLKDFPALLLVVSFLWGAPGIASDAPWYDPSPWTNGVDMSRVPDISSVYLRARDGTRLAITVHLPENLEKGAKVPALLIQTRYWRRGGEAEMSGRYFTQQGYGFVAVDVRGTGASFGTRRYTLSPEEVADGREILDWIAAQPWSNGKIGSVGGSYTGATAAMLLSHAHPGLLAVAPGQIAFDFFENIFFPGGIYCRGVLQEWQLLVRALDSNDNLVAQFPGLAPIDDDPNRKLLQQALAEHEPNFLIHDAFHNAQFRDETIPDAQGNDMSPRDVGMHIRADAMKRAKTVMINLSGWYDGALQMGAIHRHLQFPSPHNRLVLGPWDHKLAYISPAVRRSPRSLPPSSFSSTVHYARFFDRHLKGIQGGTDDDPPVYYFTMIEERWKSSSTWPPKEIEPTTYYFGSQSQLQSQPPGRNAKSDRYEVDFSTGTGKGNRWGSIVNMSQTPIGYFNRAQQQEKLLTFTTSALEQAVEVTGHPRARLYLQSSTPDAAVHVYLEDVAPSGDVRYVTEGILRISHRATSPSPYATPVLYRSHSQKDADPVEMDEIVELKIDLYPTSYLFEKGHSIRLGIAGADQDSFVRVPQKGPAPIFHLHKTEDYPSSILLPQMPQRLQKKPGTR